MTCDELICYYLPRVTCWSLDLIDIRYHHVELYVIDDNIFALLEPIMKFTWYILTLTLTIIYVL